MLVGMRAFPAVNCGYKSKNTQAHSGRAAYTLSLAEPRKEGGKPSTRLMFLVKAFASLKDADLWELPLLPSSCPAPARTTSNVYAKSFARKWNQEPLIGFVNEAKFDEAARLLPTPVVHDSYCRARGAPAFPACVALGDQRLDEVRSLALRTDHFPRSPAPTHLTFDRPGDRFAQIDDELFKRAREALRTWRSSSQSTPSSPCNHPAPAPPCTCSSRPPTSSSSSPGKRSTRTAREVANFAMRSDAYFKVRKIQGGKPGGRKPIRARESCEHDAALPPLPPQQQQDREVARQHPLRQRLAREQEDPLRPSRDVRVDMREIGCEHNMPVSYEKYTKLQWEKLYFGQLARARRLQFLSLGTQLGSFVELEPFPTPGFTFRCAAGLLPTEETSLNLELPLFSSLDKCDKLNKVPPIQLDAVQQPTSVHPVETQGQNVAVVVARFQDQVWLGWMRRTTHQDCERL